MNGVVTSETGKNRSSRRQPSAGNGPARSGCPALCCAIIRVSVGPASSGLVWPYWQVSLAISARCWLKSPQGHEPCRWFAGSRETAGSVGPSRWWPRGHARRLSAPRPAARRPASATCGRRRSHRGSHDSGPTRKPILWNRVDDRVFVARVDSDLEVDAVLGASPGYGRGPDVVHLHHRASTIRRRAARAR